MLKSFSVERYKPFVDRTTIELRPLTLLFGHNNAGKSALLRVVPLLAESILDTGRSPLKRSPATRGGTFDDLLSRIGPPSASLATGLGWTGGCTFDVEIRDLPERHRQVVTRLLVTRDGRSVEARWIPREDEAGLPGQQYEVAEGDERKEAHIEMRGLVPHLRSDEDSLGWSELFSQQGLDLQRHARGVQWLASLRASPDRSFKPGDAPPTELQADGSGYQEVLFFDKVDRGGILEQVSGWFEEHFEQALDLHHVGDNAFLSLSPTRARALRIPLADTGEGMAQVLPVLVALAMARSAVAHEPRVVVLEQPELHLHPAAELALAGELARTAAAGEAPVMIVETHSENLLLSIQLQVAEGKLPVDRVAVYWVERLEDGRAVARQIGLDETGQARGWPPGVFSEDLELARKLYCARKAARAS